MTRALNDWTVQRAGSLIIHKHRDGHAEVVKVWGHPRYSLYVDGRKQSEHPTWRAAREAYKRTATRRGNT